MASRDASGVASSICLAKQADLEAVAFSCTGRRLARAAYGLGFRQPRACRLPLGVRGSPLHVGIFGTKKTSSTIPCLQTRQEFAMYTCHSNPPCPKQVFPHPKMNLEILYQKYSCRTERGLVLDGVEGLWGFYGGGLPR